MLGFQLVVGLVDCYCNNETRNIFLAMFSAAPVQSLVPSLAIYGHRLTVDLFKDPQENKENKKALHPAGFEHMTSITMIYY